MNLLSLIDPMSGLVVVGGTALATLLRVGASDCKVTWRVLRHLGSSEFDEDHLRSDLARMVVDLQTDGIWRTEPYYFRDDASRVAGEAMIKARSLAVFYDKVAKAKTIRLANARKAYKTLTLAAETAPAFGLAGTLLALSQMPAEGNIGMGAVLAAAVLTTLYGVLLAHLMLTPLAEAIRRSSEREEEARDQHMRWTEGQLENTVIRLPDETGFDDGLLINPDFVAA